MRRALLCIGTSEYSPFEPFLYLSLLMVVSGCASNLVASQAGSFFQSYATACARDDDPELVWEAVPVVLKAIDARLISNPHDTQLLVTAASLYTRYAYGGLAQDADLLEARDYERAGQLRGRAGHLLRRARDYGLRGLARTESDYRERLSAHPKETLARATAADVPLLYWTAAAWGAAISLEKADPELTADQFVVEAIMRRALELNDRFESGAVHCFMISYEGTRALVGGSYDRAEEHFRKALQLAGGRLASPYVTYAESVLLPRQMRTEFVNRLQEALQVPLDLDPDQRLANTIDQRRARWLLDRADEFFLEP
jgi:hypothetical protein